MFLYEVRLRDGTTNKNWMAFNENISRLNGKSPDFGGRGNLVLIKHHKDKETVKMLCTENFKGRDTEGDVEIAEITGASLAKGAHMAYAEMVESYFKPYDNFPNI